MPRTVARYEPAMDVGLLVPYPDYWAHSGEVSVYPGLPCSFLLWKGACKAKVGVQVAEYMFPLRILRP